MQAEREAALDEPNSSFQRCVLGKAKADAHVRASPRNHEADSVLGSGSVVALQGKLAVCGNLKQPFAIGSHGRD